MNIQPLRDNIAILPEKETAEGKTNSGIYIPETAEAEKEKPQIGKIIAIGDNEKIVVKKGNKVIFNKYSGTEISIDNKKYLIIKNSDILAIIK